MSMKMTITTKGVKGASMLPKELITNLPKILGQGALESYANDVVENMQMEAPVDTGYLRSLIRWHRIDPYTVQVTSWAPYSGYVDQGTHIMGPRPYFSDNTLNSANIGADEFMTKSINYINILINKYQNMP